MPKKGNGLDLTNDYLRQLLDLSREQNQRLGRLEEQQKEQAASQREQAAVQREQAAALRAVQEGIRQLNDNMAQVASFVGRDKLRLDNKIEDMERRLQTLERRSA